METKIRKVVEKLIDGLPDRKIALMISVPDLVKGFWENILRYGVPFTPQNHQIVVQVIEEKLEGPHFERDWTEKEWHSFVKFQMPSPEVA